MSLRPAAVHGGGDAPGAASLPRGPSSHPWRSSSPLDSRTVVRRSWAALLLSLCSLSVALLLLWRSARRVSLHCGPRLCLLESTHLQGGAAAHYAARHVQVEWEHIVQGEEEEEEQQQQQQQQQEEEEEDEGERERMEEARRRGHLVLPRAHLTGAVMGKLMRESEGQAVPEAEMRHVRDRSVLEGGWTYLLEYDPKHDAHRKGHVQRIVMPTWSLPKKHCLQRVEAVRRYAEGEDKELHLEESKLVRFTWPFGIAFGFGTVLLFASFLWGAFTEMDALKAA